MEFKAVGSATCEQDSICFVTALRFRNQISFAKTTLIDINRHFFVTEAQCACVRIELSFQALLA